jgi:excinuclease ABC subunit C
MGTNTVASMVVFEGGAPKKSDYRRFKVLGDGRDGGEENGSARENSAPRTLPRPEGPDDFAAMEEILGRRFSRWQAQRDVSPHDKEYDPGFAALPNVVVIDGGKGQLAAGLAPLRGFRERGVAVVALAKRIEELFVPGRRAPLVLDHSTPELQLLQRVRDEAHRFAITHHRSRRDRAMTRSLLDELPGVGPARKRSLLAHFGAPDSVVAATREELEVVPGLPAKVGRELYAHLHRAG